MNRDPWTVASTTLAPRKRPSDAKLALYECEIVPEFEQPQDFPVRLYPVAMIFMFFVIRVVFMYPFTVVFCQLGKFGLIEVVDSLLTVFAAMFFLVTEGALTWGAVKRLRLGMPSLSSLSTIRRIGAEPYQAV
jgi:NADH-quinone oxidoreductase subunit A